MRHLPATVLCLLGAVAAQDRPPRLYVVPRVTPAQLALLQQQFDLPSACCGVAHGDRVEVVVDATEVAALLTIAPQALWVGVGRPFATIEAERFAASGEDAPDAGYYTVAEVEAEIDAMVAAHPGLAHKVNLSALPGGLTTLQGRSIFALKVSDNAAADEDEPAIVLAAQHHARELNSPHMVIRAMQRVLAGYGTDPVLQDLVDGHELWFVPMCNPDGVDYVWSTNNLWRKNRRNNGGSFGVDQNRNYPFLWSLCGSSATGSSETYRGPTAGSEPETQTLRNLMAWLRPQLYLDFHSYGRDVLRMWAPCATVSPAMFTLQEHYVDALRAPMGYDKRDPSGSGEAPEDHFASGGTLSFLIEVGTSFQPPFVDTVAEEAMVWPGVAGALQAWRPALRGHVRSSLGSQPLAATISFAPNVLNHGEVTKSRARDGRYGLWLPIGTWDVTFAAPGHQSRTVPVTVAGYDAPVDLEVLLETGAAASITKVGSGQVGTTVTFTYTSPGDAGKDAFFGWSFGTVPGIDLGGLRVIPLNNDFLFTNAWIGNPFLAPTWVTLDGNGQAQCVLSIPPFAWLAGLTTYVGGMTFDPGYQYTIKTWSPALDVTIVP